MPETLAPPQVKKSSESKESYERYRKVVNELGGIAVGDGLLYRVGVRKEARSALKDWRKNLAQERSERFNNAADEYDKQAELAKKKIKFAKKGFGSRQKRALVKKEAEKAYRETRANRVGKGLSSRINNRLEARANYKTTKEQAKKYYKSIETREAGKLTDYKIERATARAKSKRALDNADRYGKSDKSVRSVVKERGRSMNNRLVVQPNGSRVIDYTSGLDRQLQRSAARRHELGVTRTPSVTPSEAEPVGPVLSPAAEEEPAKLRVLPPPTGPPLNGDSLWDYYGPQNPDARLPQDIVDNPRFPDSDVRPKAA